MVSVEQATRVRAAINRVITSLIGQKYKVPEGGQTLAVIQKGIDKINKLLFPYSDMADDRIIDYVVYHLYLKREPRWGISITDLFTDYAINKYRQQFMSENGKSGINYFINQWLDDAYLTRSALVKMIEKPKPHKMSKFIYLESEELIKKRFYNTEMGYMLCQRSTTGYAPRSSSCQGCRFTSRCQENTDKKYPELLRLRRKDYCENGKEK